MRAREGGGGSQGEQRSADAPASAPVAAPPAPPEREVVPPRTIDGQVNPEHFRVRLRNLNVLNEWHQQHRQNLVKGYDQTLKGILREAKLSGLREADVASAVGVEDRTRDLIESMLDSPSVNHLLEADDAVLDRLEAGVKASIDGCKLRLEQLQEDAEAEADTYRGRLTAGKAWLTRLHRLRRVRADAREVFPKHRPTHDTLALQASIKLRRMVYIMRSDISESADDDGAVGGRIGRRARVAAADLVLEVPFHICKVSVSEWVARNGVKFYAQGHQSEVRAAPHLFTLTGGAKKNCFTCEGLLIVAPPRHMKTTYAAAWMTDELINNQRLQCFLLHAVEPSAQKNYELVRQNFREDEAAGRRMRALFPEIRLRKSTNEETWFDVPEKTKNAQLSFAGVRQGKLGTNVDRLGMDDPVERAEVHAEQQRERTHKQVTQVFMPRVQGRRPFTLITTTLWHDDDTNCRLIRQIDAGKLNFAYIIQAAGGPKSNPPFKPLWPERYDAKWLKRKYDTMQDPVGYACQFEAKTKLDELRIIKRLGLYLARVDDDAGHRVTDCAGGNCGKCVTCLLNQHRRFLLSAEFHLSLDPSATSKREVKRHTDRAGLVWGAKGDVVRETVESGYVVENRRTELRILDASSFFASGSEAVNEIKLYSQAHRVDKVHLEVVGFSQMIVDSVRNQFDLGARQVVAHPPKNLSKGQRLQAIALLLDDSPRDVGLSGASILFPGVLRADGSITIDERFRWMERQIIDFGSTGENHVVDALTQLGKHVAHELHHGQGAVSEAVREVEDSAPGADIRSRMAKEYAREEPTDDVYAEEVRFLVGSSWRA